MPTAATSLLDAVNTCLAAIGESPVNTTATTEILSVTQALQFITEVSRSMQSKVWNFNSDEDWPLSRDPQGRLPVPSNVLRIDTSRSHGQYDVVQRGAFLYDRNTRSFTFDSDVKVDVTWFLPFEDLPEAARWYVTVAAARKLQARMLGSESREMFAAKDEQEAWATLKEAEGDVGDYNMFDRSYTVASALQRFP